MLGHRCSLVTIALLTGLLSAPLGAAELTEARIRAYYAAWSAAELDSVMSYFADGAVYEDVATGDLSKGKDEVRAFARKFLESTPGVQVVPTSILIADQAAAVEWTMSAGEGEEAWSVRGVAVMDFAGGLITRATDYWNAE